ncbi:MAG: hypothetical protein ACW964_05315 [Candidatus Hodarchaeales archaeon]
MTKFQSTLLIGIIFSLISNSMLLTAKIDEKQSFGVEEGAHFSLLVTSIPNRPGFTQGGEMPGGVNVTELINFKSENFTLKPVINPLPPVGEKIDFNVSKIPQNSFPGRLSINISQNFTELNLFFVLGEPVVSNNWERWTEILNTMVDEEIIDNKSIALVDLVLNDTFFQSVLIFKPEIPSSIQFIVRSIEIKQTLRYFVSSGIQDLMEVEITFRLFMFGTTVSTTSLEYVQESYTPIRVTQSTPRNIFIDILILSLVIVSFTSLMLFLRKIVKKSG